MKLYNRPVTLAFALAQYKKKEGGVGPVDQPRNLVSKIPMMTRGPRYPNLFDFETTNCSLDIYKAGTKVSSVSEKMQRVLKEISNSVMSLFFRNPMRNLFPKLSKFLI